MIHLQMVQMGHGHEQRFLKRNKDGYEISQKCSLYLAIREMKIKTTLRLHLKTE